MQNKHNLDSDTRVFDEFIREIYQKLSNSTQDIIYESMDDVIDEVIKNLELKIFPNCSQKSEDEKVCFDSENFVSDLDNVLYYQALLKLSKGNKLENTFNTIINKEIDRGSLQKKDFSDLENISIEDLVENAIQDLKLKICLKSNDKYSDAVCNQSKELISSAILNLSIDDLKGAIEKENHEDAIENIKYKIFPTLDDLSNELLYRTLLKLSIDSPLEKTPEEIIDRDSLSKLISARGKLLLDVSKNTDLDINILLIRIVDEFPNFKIKIKKLITIEESQEAPLIEELTALKEENNKIDNTNLYHLIR